MNIPAELRRSATEEASPIYGVNATAWRELQGWLNYGEWAHDLDRENKRTLMLLVACAVESES